MAKKYLSLTALAAAGATLFQGCFGNFIDGFLNEGFSFGGPAWIDVVLDVVREDLFS
jgi:hypothetical protein